MHYEYLIVWVDGIPVMAKDPMKTIRQLVEMFSLKGIGQPEYFLGADIKMVETPEKVFTMGSHTYVIRVLKQFETMMGYAPPARINTPTDPKDHPKLNRIMFVNDAVKKTILGMVQWASTIGRMDIQVAVMIMRRFRMQPRIGHLKRVERIFGFLRNFKACSIKLRTDQASYGKFKNTVVADWKYIYGDAKEELLDKMLEPKGKMVTILLVCDTKLYCDKTTGRAVCCFPPLSPPDVQTYRPQSCHQPDLGNPADTRLPLGCACPPRYPDSTKHEALRSSS